MRIMSVKSFLITMAVAGMTMLSTKAAEVDQLKSDLIGHSMGGREKCWKFQSTDQIQQVTIKKKEEELGKRIYTVALQLRAAKDSARYAAEARVEYVRTGGVWKVQQVGLLSLSKVE
jgi:hypothetical protein